MFEFLVEKEQEKRKLSDVERNKIAQDVGDLFQTWDDARNKQKAIEEKLRPEIYLDDRIQTEKEKSFFFKQRDGCKSFSVKILIISFSNKKALPFPSVRPF